MSRKVGATFALGLIALGAGCSRESSEQKIAALPPLQTLTVSADARGDGRAWDGVIEAVRRADLTAQTAGRVTTVNVDVNSRVAAGTVLLRLTAIEQQAGANTAMAQLRAAEAAAREAEQNYQRFAALAEGKYVSRAQIDQARAARDSAKAARDAAAAQVSQAAQQARYTVITAPFDGIVSRRDVQPGESVAPGQPLMSVYAPGELRIEVAVPQSQADAIRGASSAEVRLEDGRGLQARSVTVFPAADPATHSVNVRVLLPNASPQPAPGSTAKVIFPMAAAGPTQTGHIEVPTSAVVQRGELSAVYVLQQDRLLLRQLRLGARRGDRIEVLAGLSAGEKIASDPVAAGQALAAQRGAAAK